MKHTITLKLKIWESVADVLMVCASTSLSVPLPGIERSRNAYIGPTRFGFFNTLLTNSLKTKKNKKPCHALTSD
jgi:hypothetical protein